MNLFTNYFITVFIYNFLTSTSVVCRISDQKKCADAACSQPISLATTLLQYHADGEKKVSFPRNLKVKVFSKEAGDIPNFWEIEDAGSDKCMNYHWSRKHFLELCHEVYGKRGYVQKGLLREEKVYIPSSKLTHIVPTGRNDTPKQNVQDKDVATQESNPVNLLSATPELPVANSKGLFSTIGGVSADSVPMNPPDISPQSTRKFQVFEGTTVFDDVVTETPESPPISIHDNENVNQKSIVNSQPSVELVSNSNVPLSDFKPVTEQTNENEQLNGNEAIDKEVIEVTKDETDQLTEGGGEESSTPGLMSEVVSNIANYMFSGAGATEEESLEEEEEDEGEEGSAAEEENGEEEQIPNQETVEKGMTEELNEDTQPSPFITPESPDVDDNMLIQLKSTEIQESNNNNTIEEEEQLEKTSFDVNKSEMIEDYKVEQLSASKSSEVDKLELESVLDTHDSHMPKEIASKDPDESEQPPQHSLTQVEEKLLEDGKIEDNKSFVKEPFFEKAEIQSNVVNAKPDPKEQFDESQVAPDEKSEDQTKVDEDKVEKQPKIEGQAEFEETKDEESNKTNDDQITDIFKTDVLQVKSQLETYVPQVTEEKSKTEEPVEEKTLTIVDEGKEEVKTMEENVTEQSVTGKPEDKEQLKHVEEQINSEDPNDKDELKSEELPAEQAPETATNVPSLQPGTRNFLYSSGKPRELPESTLQSESSDEVTVGVEPLNDTEQDIPQQFPVYSSTPLVPRMGSPKYSAVVSSRIQSSESHEANQVESDSVEEKLNSEESLQSTSNKDALPSHLSPDSQSPKYSNVVNDRIGPITTSENLENEIITETVSDDQTKPDETLTPEDEFSKAPTSETWLPQQALSEETKSIEEMVQTSNEALKIDTLAPIPPESPDDIPAIVPDAPAEVVDKFSADTASDEGIFSWITSYLDVFGSIDTRPEESPSAKESLEPSRITELTEETCSADGLEGSCPMIGVEKMKEVSWQETSYSSDMWELLDRVPLEVTIWLIVTAVVVLIFSLGHYYIEAHRRDGPLVAVINKLEREVLILKKETCIMEDRLQVAQQELEAWSTSSTENDALVVELKQELDEIKAAKAELEEQAAQLKDELETVTESGLEMHRLLEESLSSQDGSQVLLSTVETLREKLQRQEEEISGLSNTLSSKDAEVEELQAKLAHSAEVARGLEDRVISVSREKDEELLKLREKHRELISQLEEVMETKALEETRLSTEMSKLRLTIEELQKTLAEKDAELDTLKEVVKQVRSTDSNEKMEALFDVVAVQAKLKIAVTERDDWREKFLEEEGARTLLEGHMKKITQEVADVKKSYEMAEKEKVEALQKLQVLSNYFKEKESELQKELGLQESMWLHKQSDDHTIYEQMRSLREENEKYKLQNESLKKEIIEQEASFKIQLANTEQKAHENWVLSRQAERKVKEAQQEAAQLRNRLTTVEKNSANYSLDEKQNISESNGDPSSPPPSLMFPPTTSPPFMMYGPPIPPGEFVPPPPLMGSPYPSDSRPPPLGRISSPPLDPRFSPPPPLPYPPYNYSPYGHHSPSPPPPLPHHRNVHKPQPREMSREQKEHVPTYSPDTEKKSRRNNR